MVEGVALVVGRLVDQSVHWVELGVAEGVAKEAGVARRGVGLDLRSWYLTLEQEDEVMGCDLVVLNPLEEPPVVILHEPPVQHDLELTTGGAGAAERLTRDQGQSAVRVLDVAH